MSVLPIVFSAGADAGSIIQTNGGAAVDGFTCFAGAIVSSATDSLSATGTLIRTLENIVPSSNGCDDDERAAASLAHTTHPFINCTGNGLSVQPRGAVVRGTLRTVREARTDSGDDHASAFAFSPGAADAAKLTAIDFREGAAFDLNFIVRFRGFDDGVSDKVAAMVVPLPPAFALGLAGLAGAMIAARRVTRRLSA